MSYARVLDDAITSTAPPPDLLEPDDVTANGQWWDLRRHDYSLETWEGDIVAPHGWLPVTTTPRPPDTATTTADYSVELVNLVPTEVWTERPWTPAELEANEKAANTTQLTAESGDAVNPLLAVVAKINLLLDATNADINQNPAAVIKDLARELKHSVKQSIRSARLQSGETGSADTGS